MMMTLWLTTEWETVKKNYRKSSKTPTQRACWEAVISWDLPEPILNMPWNAWNRKSREYAILCLPMIWSGMEEALAPVLESQKKDAVGQAENRLEFVSEMGEFSDVDEFS